MSEDGFGVEPLHQRRTLVGGELRPWSGPTDDVVSPVLTHGQPTLIGSQPSQGEVEALQALAAAKAAWNGGRGDWPTMPAGERIARVLDFAARMVGSREKIVRLLMWEIGKTRADSEKEFDRTVEYIRDTVAAVQDLDHAGARFERAGGVVAQIRRAPLGVVLCMGPFNYPLNETFTTLIPALVMGNPVVVKPPKLGVLLHEPLLDAFAECFPPGVVNTLHGDGRTVVTPLMKSGDVDVLAFIGTSRVADIVRTQHPRPHRLRCILGLDAKNPALVTAKADLDLAVRECLAGALSFNGQRCTAIKLIFVQRSVYGAFVERLAAAVDALKPGLPWEPGAQITPLPEPGKVQGLESLIDDAKAKGASIVNARAGAMDATMFFPAVVAPVAPTARLASEEQFGPIVPVTPYEDDAEVLRWVTESNFGQQAAVFSEDPVEVARLVDGLVNQVCRVNVNSQCQRGPDVYPFTGRKDSAEGTLSVSDALRVFSIRSMVAARDEARNHTILRNITREGRSSFLSTEWLF